MSCRVALYIKEIIKPKNCQKLCNVTGRIVWGRNDRNGYLLQKFVAVNIIENFFPQTYHRLFQECKSESFASHFRMIRFGRLLNSILWMLFSRLTFVEISISFSRLWSHLKIDQVLNCLMLLLPASIFSKLAFIEPVKRVSWFSCRMTAIRHWISLDRIRSFYPQCSL